MSEPCKAGKCISYPVCNQMEVLKECNIFQSYLTEYITQTIKPIVLDMGSYTTFKMSSLELQLMWNYVETIFPNVKVIGYYNYNKTDKRKCNVIYNFKGDISW